MLKAKQKRREEALQRRKKYHGLNATRAAQKICDTWGAFGETFQSKLAGDKITIGGYVSTGSEINPSSLLNMLADKGHQIGLPVSNINDGSMLFRAFRPRDELCMGGVGMFEPLPEKKLIVPDLIFLPLLGFDASGTRLGRGGGYYDRVLENLRSKKTILAVGLAYEAQYFEALPCQIHDEKLNAVMTDKQIRVFSLPAER